jgi:hypothetical protein
VVVECIFDDIGAYQERDQVGQMGRGRRRWELGFLLEKRNKRDGSASEEGGCGSELVIYKLAEIELKKA